MLPGGKRRTPPSKEVTTMRTYTKPTAMPVDTSTVLKIVK
jgi:hypothetical protein